MTRGSPTPPGTSQAPGGTRKLYPHAGPSVASTYPRGPVRPLLPPASSSLPSLPLLPSRRRLKAAGPGGAAPRSPQPRAPAPPPRPAGQAAEPGLGTSGRGAGHEVGRARVLERRRGTAGSRPRLEPVRCAMELWGPRAPQPPLLLPLLLLLGVGLLPGKFQNAERFFFLPGPGIWDSRARGEEARGCGAKPRVRATG